MIDSFICAIDRLQAQGAVVVIKWDGERTHDRLTLLISRRETGHVFRRDGESLADLLNVGLNDYAVSFAQPLCSRHPGS